MSLRSVAFSCVVLLGSGCSKSSKPAPSESRILGGRVVPGETLEHGRRIYRSVCESCHGAQGDGRGRLGLRQDPKPRSFIPGVMKFAVVPAGSLWRPADVVRIVSRGLDGTQMVALPLPAQDIEAVAEFVATFSPRFETETIGAPVSTPEPFPVVASALVSRGEEVYEEAGCGSCHDAGKAAKTVWGDKIKAPKLRGYSPKAGSTEADLFRTVAAGVGGIEGKEALAGARSEADLVALVHYLRTVVTTQGSDP